MTLAELVVAMGIFMVVVAVFLSGVVALTRSTVRSGNEADVATDLRRVFTQVDRTVRYADAVDYPGTSGSGAWYAEVRSSTVRGTPPVCTQWRWTPTSSRLDVRTWPAASGVAAAGAWRTLATTVVGPTTTAPFTMTPAGVTSSRVRQTLAVDLVAAKGTGAQRAQARTSTSFVARNSSQSSPGNSATAASAGTAVPVSASPACGDPATTRT
ncbi:hypothetical protein WDZ17_05050 [Pseudokineococcus basanitobsidens]|uniref:Pilin/secretion family protein with methylation motif n=1 Tax=Pseudokineococcus basanitobsidens TaxID=1926649 RepID=A0ABU8RHY5_9ACTN